MQAKINESILSEIERQAHQLQIASLLNRSADNEPLLRSQSAGKQESTFQKKNKNALLQITTWVAKQGKKRDYEMQSLKLENEHLQSKVDSLNKEIELMKDEVNKTKTDLSYSTITLQEKLSNEEKIKQDVEKLRLSAERRSLKEQEANVQCKEMENKIKEQQNQIKTLKQNYLDEVTALKKELEDERARNAAEVLHLKQEHANSLESAG